MRPARRREGELVGDEEGIDVQHLVEVAKPGQITRLDSRDPRRHRASVAPPEERAEASTFG
jgi:hypothetical protein